jgi:AcrR family transcriptional regulator
LFYRHGIRAVGVDRVLAESSVTRVTFYRHFPSKDALVVAYLQGRWDRDRAQLDALGAKTPGDPEAVLLGLADVLLGDIGHADFRGCPYLNAVAEFDDPSHPARAVCAGHRRWLRAEVAHLLTEAAHPQAELVAEQLVMLRAGAMAVAAAAEGDGTAQAFLQGWRRFLSPAADDA